MEQISIILMPREDGGLRILSNDEPSLILSGLEPEKVLAAVWPALAAIKKHRAEVEEAIKRIDYRRREI